MQLLRSAGSMHLHVLLCVYNGFRGAQAVMSVWHCRVKGELVVRAYSPVSSDDDVGYFELVIKVRRSTAQLDFSDCVPATRHHRMASGAAWLARWCLCGSIICSCGMSRCGPRQQ